MKFKESFLSWLFGSAPQEPEEPLATEQPAEQEELSAQPVRHALTLPQGHTLRKLWAVYTEESGWQPSPQLVLEGPDDPILPEDTAKWELARLQAKLNVSANQRFEQLRPKNDSETDGGLPKLDAHATVFVSKDQMTAWLLVYPPVAGGREADSDTLRRALGRAEVCHGIDEDLLAALPQDPERYFRLVQAAHGTPMVPGTDGYVVDLYPRTEERKLTVDEHNRVNYSDLNFIRNIEKGKPICRIFPPVEGTPGRTVLGSEIPPGPVKPATAPKGRNTELSEDGSTLFASRAGHVEFTGRSFQVKPVMEVPGNVDFSVGNINFLGDVHIHGDVLTGFTVRAMGNIVVDGVVEACSIEAGRDLIVAKGIQGDNQCVVRAQGSIFAKYMENSCIYAKTSLETECIINCDVYCDGSVFVHNGHRNIIGGKIHAAHEVSAGIIGTRVENRADIFLGGKPCEEFDQTLLVREVAQLEDEIIGVERQPESPDKLSRLGRLHIQLVMNRGKLEQLQKKPEPSKDESSYFMCHMQADTVYPGTVLTIGGQVRRFERKTSPCYATFINGEIHLT